MYMVYKGMWENIMQKCFFKPTHQPTTGKDRSAKHIKVSPAPRFMDGLVSHQSGHCFKFSNTDTYIYIIQYLNPKCYYIHLKSYL